MDLKMGSQRFQNVSIPLLWGERAVLQDKSGRISVIYLGGKSPEIEVLGDKPAAGVEFVPRLDGFSIHKSGEELYSYDPSENLLTSGSLALPDCRVTPSATIVGGNVFAGNTIGGFGVGIVVSKNGIGMGAPVPPNLARLII